MTPDSNPGDEHPSRRNSLRSTVEDGGVALGVLDDLYSPAMVEIYGDLDFDFVWHDLEHAGPAPTDAEALGNLLRAADAVGTELLVRIPSSDPATIHKALDTGVRNLFVSRVETAEQVRRAVHAAHFTYDGEPGGRGLANPRASRWGQADDYAGVEDREPMIGVTIEEPSAVEAIDDILAVPELDFVFLGPLDLSVSVGAPGEVDHPDVQDAVETVVSTARDEDVVVGGLGFGEDDVAQKIDDGYQILHVGSTTAAAAASLESWPEKFGDR
ncbi:aldolase/citrate lyase family protein [Halomontanus rarus]|uniref:aldolase/citrate lyase family protein n=1 Tax=Halomontanus rarus TaxID=3034020 RepID=UPI001A9A1B93